ncbi:uncharacterized protein LOC136082557 [Hydra vulgaris]|uniref:Uncharacterized protein LOC136082557 n=1 Tax=Hydra vulgaris TaxID=6087 RepID=A0ABM4C8U6_HYDVU
MKDIKIIEKIQRRSTKVPTICKHLCYTDRCILFQIQKLEDRRIRGDLIQKFKIEKGLTIINWHNEPIIRPARYGQREQFVREFNRNCDPRYHFFSNRVAKHWNALNDQQLTVPRLKNLNECLTVQLIVAYSHYMTLIGSVSYLQLIYYYYY